MTPPKVLLIGYNGANNTGAEALLQADIEDLRAVFGDDALLTVPALKDPANLRRYLHEGPTCRSLRCHPSSWAPSGAWSVSTTSSCWSRAARTWTRGRRRSCGTSCGRPVRDQEGKPCLAYAVDAGQLRPRNQRLVRR